MHMILLAGSRWEVIVWKLFGWAGWTSGKTPESTYVGTLCLAGEGTECGATLLYIVMLQGYQFREGHDDFTCLVSIHQCSAEDVGVPGIGRTRNGLVVQSMRCRAIRWPSYRGDLRLVPSS